MAVKLAYGFEESRRGDLGTSENGQGDAEALLSLSASSLLPFFVLAFRTFGWILHSHPCGHLVSKEGMN